MRILLNTRQVAKILNISICHVSRLITEGKLKSFKNGKEHKISAISVENYRTRKRNRLPKIKYLKATEIWKNLNNCITITKITPSGGGIESRSSG